MTCRCDVRVKKMKAGIEIVVVYSDVHLMEVQISAANTAFAGQVNTYVNHDAAEKFSVALSGFPANVDDVRRMELGANAKFAFSMIDDVGHSMVAVDIASDTMGPNGFTGRATFNILVNPAEIDQFVQELAKLTPEIGQSAYLEGS